MNEPAVLPAPDEPVTPAEAVPHAETAAPPTEPRPRRDSLPWVFGAGFLLLAAAIAYLWVNMTPADTTMRDSKDLDAVNQRISDLDAKLDRIDHRPQPVSAADFAKLSARIDALDGRLANQTEVASKVDTVSGRIDALSSRSQTALDALKQQLADLSGQVSAQQNAAGNLDALGKRLDLMAKLQKAAFALSVGEPVGEVPGAPPSLSKYAHTPPPTEAQLRLSFPQAEARALAKPQPDTVAAPFMDRVWEKAQGLVTVRRGDDVVVGDATAMALNQARSALQAGDLPGAIKAVESLKGDPAQAMASWLAEAKDLENARAALAQMAGQS